MEDRFEQQLKKGVLEMLALELICRQPSYGYKLITQLKQMSQERFQLKEGTLYPILYRLEDEGLIAASWSQREGRTASKKIYTATDAGRLEARRRQQIWQDFSQTVTAFYQEGEHHD